MTGEETAGWLDEQSPHDDAHSAAQVRGLAALLTPAPRRLLDLGCGTGRVLVPLAERGHHVVGLDRSADVLARCRERLAERGLAADLVNADFNDPWPERGPVDAVLCFGNTFMTIADVDAAVIVLRRAAAVLRPGGAFIMDDCPADFWPELVEGNWQGGVDETGTMQLAWHESDAVFALRHGDAVDPGCAGLAPGDRRLRLWTDGAVRLAACAAGLSAPERDAESHLLVLRRPAPGAGGSNADAP